MTFRKLCWAVLVLPRTTAQESVDRAFQLAEQDVLLLFISVRVCCWTESSTEQSSWCNTPWQPRVWANSFWNSIGHHFGGTSTGRFQQPEVWDLLFLPLIDAAAPAGRRPTGAIVGVFGARQYCVLRQHQCGVAGFRGATFGHCLSFVDVFVSIFFWWLWLDA